MSETPLETPTIFVGLLDQSSEEEVTQRSHLYAEAAEGKMTIDENQI